ncbi:uncharacterized protein [Lolium perenne]|uniref:uncharacterized protein n=1 Tax=Lolium perenne TaxID=4522 RepID=UPI0021F5DFDD|nr:uncharacterized protein LOC127328706 [Lolium perenne]
MIAEENKPIIGASMSGRRNIKPRPRMEGYSMLCAKYFADDPLHGDGVFRCHFWMNRKLFLKIVKNLREIDCFKLKRDAVGELGFSTIQKCKVALRMLSYGIAGDTCDDYLRMQESMAIDFMYRFCRAIVTAWKNCPFAQQGIYKGHKDACRVVLEAVADQDLWIWHAFFGMAGSRNTINVVQCSDVFQKLVEGNAPPVQLEINAHQYDKGYYLADDIYPR